LTIAHLQSYGQIAFTPLERLVSAAQTWERARVGFKGPGLVAIGAAGVGGLLLLAFVTLLLIRARRETRKYQKELAGLLALRKTAESASKANAEFLASMIPRIRTPMNAIVGFIHLALQTDLDPELREQLDTVRTSADWLMHIANDALEFSSIEVGGLAVDHMPFSISECILSAMKIVEREASAKRLVTSSKIDPKLPEVVCGDPIRFQHAIFNLLNYAVGFAETGSIVLSASLESDSADGVLVRVAITDTGLEIPPAARPLISEPISHADVGPALRSDPAGFGLVISRRLIDRMGGTMGPPGQLDACNAFEFTVPFQKQKRAAEIDLPIRALERLAPKCLSILVAEDSAVNRRLITKVLESDGHRVWTVTNGKEAVHKVRTEGFDLILMDLEMPGMDGLEATRAIRAAEAPNLRVPIYALTAHALPGDRDNCFAAGMDGFVAKPIAVDEVLQLVSQIALQSRTGTAEPVTDCVDSGANAGEGSFEPCVPEADTTPSTDFVSAVGDEYFDSSPYLLAKAAAGTETNGFPSATRDALNAETDIAATTAEDLPGADDDNVLERVPQSRSPLSAAEGLALLEAACELTDYSPPAVTQAVAKGATGIEINGSSGATRDALNAETDEAAADIAIAVAEDLSSADSDEANSDDNCRQDTQQSPIPLSAAESLALLEAACESTQHSPPAVTQAVAKGATGTETNSFSGATRDALNAGMDEAADIAIAVAEDLSSANSDEADCDDNVLQEIQQSPIPLSAAESLALLEAACQLTQHSPSPMKQADDPTPAAARDPFEQARKSLSKSSFGIRVVHNDGDPSDRNLI
jgi:CheY-like chemotaxis protein